MSALAAVIAIDGPSGTGKGTLAVRLSDWLGWRLLDSGALYRVLGLAAQRAGVALQDEAAVAQIAAALPVSFQEGRDGIAVLLDGADVSVAIRSEEGGHAASIVAAHPAVRTALLARQRAFRRPPGLIADGRDMGTVVFPDAELKIFLTASPDERAVRRYKQLKDKGIDATLPRLLEVISERDQRDRDRAVSPLKPADDAELIDSTALDASAVEDRVKSLVRARGLA